MNTAIVMGVGPDHGLGAQICKRFATLGKHGVVCGRTRENLDAIVDDIIGAGGTATAEVADTTNESAVATLFEKTVTIGQLDAAIYNAGNNSRGAIVDMIVVYLTNSWKVCRLGGFIFGREAIRHMRYAGGALLFTGASAALRRKSGFGAFNSSKAALRTLAQAMSKEYGKDGVHVGHVVVDGAIYGDKIKTRYPAYFAALGAQDMIEIEAIDDPFEYLYKQPKTGWSLEFDVRTAIENW